MKGRVKTYLPEKRYGFIKGDDGKDYFFHASDFAAGADKSGLCEAALVDFDQQATPKGYRARQCKLLSPESVDRFVVPDDMPITRHADVRGWELLERSDWFISSESRHSPDAARAGIKHIAETLGANGVVELQYWKSTGSEPGTGKGTHHFTIHHMRGRVVMVARRNSLGPHPGDTLRGLHDRAAAVKAQVDAKTDKANRRKTIGRIVVAACGFGVLLFNPFMALILFVLAYLVGRKEGYSTWLVYAPSAETPATQPATPPSRRPSSLTEPQ